MIYKLISCKSVIAKAFADLGLREGEYNITDMIEWCAEAVLKIGAIQSLIPKITGRGGLPLLEVSNYQAKLPCDFHSLNFIAYSKTPSGTYQPMRSTTDSFGSSYEETPHIASTQAEDIIPELDIIKTAQILLTLSQPTPDGEWTYEQVVEYLNSNADYAARINELLLEKKKKRIVDVDFLEDNVTFMVVNGYIKTNIRDCYLMISYNALPTDGDGYVLVPDKESFIEAIYWYINVKLSYQLWRLGQIRDGIYYHAEAKWRFYARQAYGQAMMPDLPTLTSIRNDWNRLFPEQNQHHSAYSQIGNQEIIYNTNTRF